MLGSFDKQIFFFFLGGGVMEGYQTLTCGIPGLVIFFQFCQQNISTRVDDDYNEQ